MFRIIFNFCRNTVAIPRDFEGGNKCDETQHSVVGDSAVTTTLPAPIFMLSKNGDSESRCYRAGLDVSDENNYQWGLYDSTDPAMGVVLQYKNGDYCCPYSTCSNTEYRQRTFTISLRCADAVSTIPEITSVETTNNECDYKIYLRSIYACPSS